MRKTTAVILSMALTLSLVGGVSVTPVSAAATVKSIEVTTLPDKCAYNLGDGYTTKGMVVKAKMSDGKSKTVDNSKIKSVSGVELTDGRPFGQEGYKVVELSYEGAKTSYEIAVFDPAKSYKISFDSNGGSAVAEQAIDASTKSFKLPQATKKGATFAGWKHSNGKTYTKYQPGIGTNVSLKAEWTYAIIYNANGGSGQMKNGTLDKDYKLAKNGFTKKGYKFVGWGTQKVLNDASDLYKVGNSAAYMGSGTGNLTLYAQWVKPGTYKISYENVKGVKLSAKAVKKYTAGKRTALVEPNTGDKNFGGWSIKGKKNHYAIYEIPPYLSGNITLKPIVYEFEG